MSAGMTGAEILIRSLEQEGIDHVFGHPGGAVLSIYDALFKQKKITHVLVRHEENAVHAADGYARSAAKVGVAIVNSGPGVTHAVTGLATAYMDSVPLVVFAGQVDTALIGQDAFQECDAIGITRPCVKHNFMVRDIADLTLTIKKAFFVATTGRPGPVLVNIPKDIADAVTEFVYPEEVEIRSYKKVDKGHSGQIRKALQLLMAAQRPVIYAGGGVISSDAAPELNALVNLLNYPCTTTLMGLGGYIATSAQYVGMPGVYGTYEANMAMEHSDVVIAIGARFDDRVVTDAAQFMSKQRQVIHIDIDPSSISKRVKATIPIVGNVKDVLIELLSQLAQTELSPDTQALTHWWKCIDHWRQMQSLRDSSSDTVIKPQAVIEALYKETEGDAYIVSDMGQHQMWTAQYYPFTSPRRFITSAGLGTPGVGLPYAIGAQIAHPKDQVVYVAGDNGLQMAIQELATCKQYGLYPKIILFNNGALGLARQWQEADYGERYAETVGYFVPDFMQIVAAYGHVGLHAKQHDDIEKVLKEGLSIQDKLVVMQFDIDLTENVSMMDNGQRHTEEWDKEVN